MTSFDFLWQLVGEHGSIAEYYKADCARLWDTYSLEQQRHIYRCIRDKLRQGRFVHYNPVKAVKENAPPPPRIQTLSFNDYFQRFGTTEERDGWKRRFLPEQHKTIYVKQ